MPYIGQRPATGEHNSFKILDDISNYTLTFGSSDIDTSADTITAREHRFVTGQRVTYGNGGGTDPTGLSNGTVYYIIVEDRHTFKLAENAIMLLLVLQSILQQQVLVLHTQSM